MLLLVAGCFGPAPRPSHRRPVRPPEPPLRQCLADLAATGARFEPLPDRSFSPGCTAQRAVKLIEVGVPVANLGAMKCGLATPYARWVRDEVRPASLATLGVAVTRIESMGSYACRPVNGVAGNPLSEHASANAVDISAFQLADGRRITVLRDWDGPDPKARAFLRALHRLACRRFSVVLGPDANPFHRDHFHFDMGPGPYCR